GESCAPVGRTACGRSTPLSLTSGLAPPTQGEVSVVANPVTGVDRRVGFVFQSDALFPWRNVLDNVAAGPIFRGMEHREALQRAGDWVRRVGLSRFERHHPHQLSGGMRKRVALAQTMINEPSIMLMDEPFS